MGASGGRSRIGGGARLRAALVALLAAAIGGLPVATAEAQQPAPVPEPRATLGGVDYGVNTLELVHAIQQRDITESERMMDRIRDMRLTTARVTLSWAATEPRRGQHDPGLLDTLVGGLAKRGVRVQFVLDSWPPWAGPPGCRHGDVSYGQPDLGALRSFVRWVADRYAAGGSFWRAHGKLDQGLAPQWLEVGNETNDPSRWCGPVDAAAYARMLDAALDALHGRTPSLRVAFAGPSNHWLDRETDPRRVLAIQHFLRAVAAADRTVLGRLDGFGLHPYGGHGVAGSGEAVLGDVVAYRQLLLALGIPPWVPILATETGVTTPPGFIDGVFRDHGSQESARAAMVRRGAELGSRNDCNVPVWQVHTLYTSNAVPPRDLTVPEDAYQRLVREEFYGLLWGPETAFALKPTAVAYRDFVVRASTVARQPHCLAALRRDGSAATLRAAHPDWFRADGSLQTEEPAAAVVRSAEEEAQAVARIRSRTLRLPRRSSSIRLSVRCLGRCRATIRDARRKRIATRVGTCGALRCRISVRLSARAERRLRGAARTRVSVRVADGPWLRAQVRPQR
ncbi:hypothetical protein [Patulibacter defluvii]|uniref:hypothetical protein n=1 Tax=Patulibacter defluvii TaxID=3095358 RepID=UPI002A75686C|nr:hypothetical protein [Patulibacter sp. DM4]